MSLAVPLIFSLCLSFHGLRKGSLSLTGSLAAFLVGFGTLNAPTHVFGVALLIFYLTGSRATKLGASRKSTLEDGHHASGNRNAAQVFSNSLPGLMAALAWTAMFAPNSWHASLISPLARSGTGVTYDGTWCPTDVRVAGGWSRTFIFVALGHFATCLGDTLSSELGILSRAPPILITTLRRVPPGTNGAISALGTFAAILGGAVIGTTMSVWLAWEAPVCVADGWGVIWELTAWGICAGLGGSLIDSIMGATIQRTRYSDSRKLILQDGHGSKKETKEKDRVRVVSGFDILSNNQVNFVSSLLCAVIVGGFA